MAWLFKPGYPPNNPILYNGQITYPSMDLEISDSSIKYITAINFVSTTQIEIKNTGFVAKAFLLSNIKINTIQFSFNNAPRYLIEQLKSLAKNVNSSGLWIKFNDNFFTGSILNPLLYYCRWKNTMDFTQRSIINSSCVINFYVSDPNPDPVQLLEFQKVIDIPTSTLQWDLQINNTGVLHEYARQP